MNAFPRIGRLAYISYILIKFGLIDLFLQSSYGRWFRPLLWVSPSRFFASSQQKPAIRLRLALEALGPIFVKFGQVLSTRMDLLSPELAQELVLLQDKVPPFPSSQACAMVERALAQPLEQVFAEFDKQALASASIAQVHAARLLNGDDVVVKILRPGIEQTIVRDVALMQTLAALCVRFWPASRRLRPVDVVAEFRTTIFDELDLAREAANASQLRRNFTDSELLYVPKIYWDWTHHNLLVMERIFGVPISQVAYFHQIGTDMQCLAERGIEIFFTQVFRDCFFHADMHPGNILVDVSDPQYPRYLAIDFGIMGTLRPFDQKYLAENLLAFFHRNYRRVAELHVESGWVPPTTRVDEFESAIRTVCEPIFARPLKDISFGGTLLRLFQTAQRFNMSIQPQLILLQKTLLSVEGLGRQLYPELDIWHSAQPHLEHWMRSQVGPRAFWHKVRRQAPYWLEKFPDVPDYLYNILQDRNEQAKYQRQVPEPKVVTHKSAWNGFILGVVFMMGLMILLATPFPALKHYWQEIVETRIWLMPLGLIIALKALANMPRHHKD